MLAWCSYYLILGGGIDSHFKLDVFEKLGALGIIYFYYSHFKLDVLMEKLGALGIIIEFIIDSHLLLLISLVL